MGQWGPLPYLVAAFIIGALLYAGSNNVTRLSDDQAVKISGHHTSSAPDPPPNRPSPPTRDLKPVDDFLDHSILRMYSSSQCYLGDNEDTYHEKILCLLRNVCVHPSNPAEILYYDNPNSPIRRPKFFYNGTWMHSVPETAWCSKMGNQLKVMHESFPSSFQWLGSKAVTIACATNPGSLSANWFSNVYPYIHAATLLRIWNPENFRLIWTNMDKSDLVECQRFYDDWLKPSGLVDGSPCHVEEFTKGGPVCFQNVVYGGQMFPHGNVPFEWNGLGPFASKLRSIVRFNLAGLSPLMGPTSHRILLYSDPKVHLNYKEIAAYLKHHFPGTEVEESDLEMHPSEQLMLLNRISIMIAPFSPQTSMALFAPRDFVLIQLLHNVQHESDMGQFVLDHDPALKIIPFVVNGFFVNVQKLGTAVSWAMHAVKVDSHHPELFSKS